MPHPNDATEFLRQQVKNPLDVLGTTGLKQSGGYISEEFLARLRGQQGIRYFQEMRENSPIIAAAMNVIELLIRQVEWRVEPADESDAAKAEVEETEGALEDMSQTFEDFVSEILSMIWAGWSAFEIIYKLRKGVTLDPTTRSQYNDGKWGWRKFEIRGQESLQRWEFDYEGGLLGWTQMDSYNNSAARGPVFIPMEKALLFRTKVYKGNPEGFSLIRPAVQPYHYLKRIQQYEAIGIERDLTGMPIMEVPPQLLLPDASDADTAARSYLERFVTQVKLDERWGGLVPAEIAPDGKATGFKFKLMTTGGKRMIDTNSIIKRYETRILMLFLAQFLMLGMDKAGGSFALSSNMTNLFSVSLGTIMDTIASVFNRFAIRRRQQLNGKPIELDPFLVHGDVESPDLVQLATFIKELAASGNLTQNDALERKLLEVAKLPQPPEIESEGSMPVDPEDGEALASAVGTGPLMGKETVDLLLTVNQAANKGELDRPAAVAFAMAITGLDEMEVERFFSEEEPEIKKPTESEGLQDAAGSSAAAPQEGGSDQNADIGDDPPPPPPPSPGPLAEGDPAPGDGDAGDADGDEDDDDKG